MKDIPKQRVSTTELSRNLANVIDQVRISRTRMTITKGSHEVAHLIPATGNGTTLADLQALLENSPLSAVEQLNFSKDIQTIRDAASLPESPWES